jgi:hypothetical protein
MTNHRYLLQNIGTYGRSNASLQGFFFQDFSATISDSQNSKPDLLGGLAENSSNKLDAVIGNDDLEVEKGVADIQISAKNE